ncbi:hypothetical protein K2173_013313 [Erythroxylum novogranatense]|uniref:Uncharacterized protein n=1 Tax=Erythroxylum novogranatense TaxID=1862640 RepID=A0AAV8S4I7_9ROSI|nr:hypothetical protein K2173_013313 [Erythroxylum novogranatense]
MSQGRCQSVELNHPRMVFMDNQFQCSEVKKNGTIAKNLIQQLQSFGFLYKTTPGWKEGITFAYTWWWCDKHNCQKSNPMTSKLQVCPVLVTDLCVQIHICILSPGKYGYLHLNLHMIYDTLEIYLVLMWTRAKEQPIFLLSFVSCSHCNAM